MGMVGWSLAGTNRYVVTNSQWLAVAIFVLLSMVYLIDIIGVACFDSPI